jgi:DNA modification methylase
MKLLLGDCLDKLKELDDNSVDSIVTDPPYGLSFMGKKWDYDVPSQAIWEECLRVLKPGGHILSFAGSRTYHRMAVRIEDAGFEIRDQIMWIYGSGFPKSHNIGKAVDKMGGKTIGWFGQWLRDWREENNITQKEVSKLFPSKTGGLTGCVANWELGLNLPTTEQFNTIIEHFDLPFENIEQLEREIVGTKSSACFGTEERHTIGSSKSVELDITKGNSQWEGWGTALKPAHEPIVMARKPLIGTVADNVLEYGVGGINIDGCRIGYTDDYDKKHQEDIRKGTGTFFGGNGTSKSEQVDMNGRFPANIIFECTCENPKVVADKYDIRAYNDYKNTFKSYEENNSVTGEYQIKDVETTKVIHTDPNCPCYILDEQSGDRKGMASQNCNNQKLYGGNSLHASSTTRDGFKVGFNDSGGASRFFYCPKASKSDRDEGMPDKVGVFIQRPRREDGSVIYKETHAEEWAEAMKGKPRSEKTSKAAAEELLQQRNSIGATYAGNQTVGKIGANPNKPTQPRANIHPTVKPTELMKYLIRLVTPKGGVVLDPFMGSGSTGKAAVREGMEFIGIEREEEYYEIAKQRIENETSKRKFW